MVAYNFQSWLAPKVESGEKRQTIRTQGKRCHARKGDALQLYTGMRTKACRKLLAHDPVCTFSGEVFITVGFGSPRVLIVGEPAPSPEAFAMADGFNSFDDMLQWFFKMHGVPFAGVLIKW